MSLRVARRAYSSNSGLAKTPLHELHLKYGGKMVDYAGFEMPVLYRGQSHIESHNWVRNRAGLFDVSHMLQHKFSGPDAVKLLEKVTPSDLKGLKPFTSTLSVLLNEKGGIVDDTIVTKHGDDSFYVVTNAGCRAKDLEFLKHEASNLQVDHQIIDGALIALQGPEAAKILQKYVSTDLSDLYFGSSRFAKIDGVEVHIARGGYTGEDGFEVSIPPQNAAIEISTELLNNEAVQPIGLAARDSLRLEAGMCLYGHELTDTTSPVAARLAWTIGKAQKANGGFNGAQQILSDLSAKKTPLRSGLISEGPAPRAGNKVFDKEGNQVGEITSGSLSPTLKKNVAMSYLPRSLAKTGTELDIEIRGKLRPAKVAKMPFVPPNYYKQP